MKLESTTFKSITTTIIRVIISLFVGALLASLVFLVLLGMYSFIGGLLHPEEKNAITECQNMKGTPQFEKKEEWTQSEKTTYHYEYIGCYIKK